MKRLLFAFFIFLATSNHLFATPQIGDILHWNDTTYFLTALPIGIFKDFDFGSKELFGVEKNFQSNCGKGYIPEWLIINDELFLKTIYDCNYQDRGKYAYDTANLAKIFPDKYKDGFVKVDWFSGDIWLSYGERFRGFSEYFYDKNTKISFKNGKISNIQYFNNSEFSIISDYPNDGEKLIDFVHSNINWDIIPDLDSNKVVIYTASTIRKPGKSDKTEILRDNSDNKLFAKEAIRVVSMIPKWTIYYYLGRYEMYIYNIPVIFSEENRTKYSKK